MKEENKIETKKKDNYWIVTVIVLAMIILGMGGYITYDKVIKPSEPEKVVESESESIKETLDDNTINTLLNMLILDGEISLYGNEKINSEENNKDFITYNLFSYMKDNNIKYNLPYGGGLDDGHMNISKEEVSNYIKKKYNTTTKYDLPVYKDADDYVGGLAGDRFYSYDEENWALTGLALGSDINNINHKVVNYEVMGDNVVLYTNVAMCQGFFHGVYCSNDVVDDQEKQLFLCDYEDETKSNNCPDALKGSELQIKEYTNYVLNNMSDKLRTYKVTYKKVDGNYYFVSSEISNG